MRLRLGYICLCAFFDLIVCEDCLFWICVCCFQAQYFLVFFVVFVAKIFTSGFYKGLLEVLVGNVLKNTCVKCFCIKFLHFFAFLDSMDFAKISKTIKIPKTKISQKL